MVQLIATKDHSFDGVRRLKAGQAFTLHSEQIAKLLIATKFARLADIIELRPKREYKRRDMKVEE